MTVIKMRFSCECCGVVTDTCEKTDAGEMLCQECRELDDHLIGLCLSVMLTVDVENGDGSVHVNEDWYEADLEIRLNMLSDWLECLSDIYAETLLELGD